MIYVLIYTLAFNNFNLKDYKMFAKFQFFNVITRAVSTIFVLTFFVAACGGGGNTAPSIPAPVAPIIVQEEEDTDTAEYLIENVGDRVFFDTDRYNLDGVARATLSSQAQWLVQNSDVRLIIEGHADERGTREYNLALGARRADAVRNYLISEGVDSFRLRTISYGKERPVSLCSEESCWSKNRRSVATIQ